jgi:hypothetical protein
MPNGHWAIPFSCAFVMKKIKDFQPENLTLEVSMTMIMRIKLTGLPEILQVIDFIKGENPRHEELYGVNKVFKARANEVEEPVMTPARSGKIVLAKSSDYDKIYTKDIIDQFFPGLEGDML